MIISGVDIEQLAGANSTARQQKLEKALQGFESMFVLQLLKSMRSAYQSSDSGSGFGKDTFMSIADQALADHIGKNDGLGIAKTLRDYFQNKEGQVTRTEVKLTNDRHLPLNQSSGLDNISNDEPSQTTPDSDQSAKEVLDQLVKLENTRASRQNKIFYQMNNDVPTQPAVIQPISDDKVVSEPLSVQEVLDGRSELQQKIDTAIDTASQTHGLPKNLLEAVIKAESGGDPEAVSPKGAKGLMQLVDSTATEMGVSDQFDPEQNIMGGARYLKKMLDRFDGDLKLALAAYNAGPGNVDKYGGVPPFNETENYVEKVINYMNEGDLSKDSKLLADKPYKEEGWSFSTKR